MSSRNVWAHNPVKSYGWVEALARSRGHSVETLYATVDEPAFPTGEADLAVCYSIHPPGGYAGVEARLARHRLATLEYIGRRRTGGPPVVSNVVGWELPPMVVVLDSADMYLKMEEAGEALARMASGWPAWRAHLWVVIERTIRLIQATAPGPRALWANASMIALFRQNPEDAEALRKVGFFHSADEGAPTPNGQEPPDYIGWLARRARILGREEVMVRVSDSSVQTGTLTLMPQEYEYLRGYPTL